MDTGALRSPKRSGRVPYKPVDDFDQTVIRNNIQEIKKKYQIKTYSKTK